MEPVCPIGSRRDNPTSPNPSGRIPTQTEIADTIKNGKGESMPPFKDKLSDEEITTLVSRVRMLKKDK